MHRLHGKDDPVVFSIAIGLRALLRPLNYIMTAAIMCRICKQKTLSKHSKTIQSTVNGVPNTFTERFFFPSVDGHSRLTIEVLVNNRSVGEAAFEIRDVLTTIKPTDLYLEAKQKRKIAGATSPPLPIISTAIDDDSIIIVACIDFCHRKRYMSLAAGFYRRHAKYGYMAN